MTRSQASKIGLACLVSVIFIGLMFANLTAQALTDAIQHMNKPAILALALTLQLQQLFGSMRFRLYFGLNRIGFLQGWVIENVGGFGAFFLPFGLGEGARVWAWSRLGSTTLSAAGGSYVLVRVLDIGAVLILVAVLSYFVPSDHRSLINHLREWSVGGVGSIILGWLWFRQYGSGKLKQWALKLDSRENAGRLATTTASVLLAIVAIGNHSPQKLLSMALASFALWAITFGEMFLLARAAGAHLSGEQILVIYLFSWASALLPIQGFARIGAHQSGWIGGLMLFGMPLQQALVIATVTHMALIVRTLAAQVITGLQFLILRLGRHNVSVVPEHQTEGDPGWKRSR